MEYKGKKFCFVPFCGARKEFNRDLIFFKVPKDKFLREQWSKAARRNPQITGPNTTFYCCQDHFNLEEDLENYEKFIQDKDKVRPHLKTNVIPHIFTCLEDIPPASDLRKRRMLLSHDEDEEIIPIAIEENVEKEEVARLTLDQINQLLIDITNLGILGDVLNAYNQVYNEMKWVIEFVVEHVGTMFSICIKKVGDETTKSTLMQQPTPLSRPVQKRRSSSCHDSAGSDVENLEEMDTMVNEALIDGGHNYSNVHKTKNISDKSLSEKHIEATPEPEIFPVYQCEYCCYGSREKYCLEHHIVSIHSKRFTVFDNEKPKSKDKSNSEMKKVIPSKNSKRMKLPYYLPRDKNLYELTKLSKEVQRRSEWLDDFIHSLLPEQKNLSKIKTGQSFSCAFCNFTGSNQIDVYKHIGLDHTTENGIFNVCPLCQLKTPDRKSLYSHLREAHPGTNLYNCKRCQYNTDSLQNYFRHIVEVHKRQREFKCNDCHFVTTRKSNLLKHLDSMHRKELFVCKEEGCGYNAPSEKALNSHVTIIHTGLYPFACTVPSCNFVSCKQYLLDRHLLQMHGPAQTPTSSSVLPTKPGKINCIFGCMQCGKKFNKKEKLEKHERIFHHGLQEQFKCGYCSYVSSTKTTMDIHIAEVHENYFPFKCDKCDFKTSVKIRFQTHYNNEHLKQKPNPCLYCQLRFDSKSALEAHVHSLHLKEKPHLCTYCSFCTAHKCNLRSHLKTIHKIPDPHINEVLKNCVDMKKKQLQENQNDIKESGMLLIGIEELGELMKDGNIIQHQTLLQPEQDLSGVVTLKESDVILPGTILHQDGNIVLHNVHTVLHDGKVVLRDGTTILQEGNAVLHDGNNVELNDGNNTVHNDVSLQCNNLRFREKVLHKVQHDKLPEEEVFVEDETLGQLLEEDSSLDDDGVLYDDEESLQGDEVLLNDGTLHSEVILHDSSNILQEMDLVIESQD